MKWTKFGLVLLVASVLLFLIHTVFELKNDIETKNIQNAKLQIELHEKNSQLQEKEVELEEKDEEIESLTKISEGLKKEVQKYKKKSESPPTVSRGKAKPTRTLVVEATSYTARCKGCTGITATGVDVRNTIYHKGERVVAVDKRIVPLGSLVKVTTKDGKSFLAYAEDTGGDIKNYRIDILVGSRSEAKKFGRQNVTIEILREGRK